MLSALDVPNEVRRVGEDFWRPVPGLKRDFAALLKKSDQN